MKLDKILSAIDSIDNMQDMNNVIASLKIRRAFLKNELARKARATFKVGDKVKISSRSKELFGVITDIKIKNAHVDIDGASYRVPLSIMEAA
jgi:hypothetical protein